jgi:hypothetical protein
MGNTPIDTLRPSTSTRSSSGSMPKLPRRALECSDSFCYSVHHLRINQRVEVRATAAIVEIFYEAERIASHRRSYRPIGTAIADPAQATPQCGGTCDH